MDDSGLGDVPTPLLDIETLQQEGIEIFVPGGAIDMSNIAEFERQLKPACSAPNARVIVDCARITYLNSSSIGLFYKFFNTCRSQSGEFALCSVNEKIHDIIRLLGLDKVLEMYPTREAAIQRLQERSND